MSAQYRADSQSIKEGSNKSTISEDINKTSGTFVSDKKILRLVIAM